MISFNGVKDAFDSIESFTSQNHLIEKFILLDNGSNKENKTLLKSYHHSKTEIIDHPSNLGFAGGFNLLFEHALKNLTSDYFLILNNDTIATPTLIENLLNIAEPNKIISPMILWNKDKETVIQSAGEFDFTMMKMKNKFEGLNYKDVPKGPHNIGQTDGCCFLIHRSWLEKGHKFNEDFFMYYEDVEFFLQLRNKGVSFIYQADAILFHKEYGSSGDRNTPSPLRNYYFFRNRFMMTQQFHSFFKRWRVYWTIFNLARETHQLQITSSPKAAKAIYLAIYHFFIGVKNKGPYPK